MSMTKRKILIVEDDTDLRALLVEAFRMEQCNAISVASGQEAMTTLSLDSFDAVLSDIRMPNGTGLDLLEHIQRDETLKIPVFLMTAYANTNSDSVKQQGAEQLIFKPFDVFHIVRQILGKNS